ncbi:MAG: PilN domain-containing protein [Panacagrimonas sp.]
MTRINLLDWRARRRELHRQRFIAMLAAGVVAAAAVFGIAVVLMNQAIDTQQRRNDFLRQQLADVDLKIKEIQELEKVKSNLLARMQVIEQLQASRSATVHFFDEVVNTLPDGVTLTLIKQTGAAVTIEGAAESNGRVSTYMKNLEASIWFDDPKLVVIKTSEADSQRRSDFTLQVKNLTNPTRLPVETPSEEIEE